MNAHKGMEAACWKSHTALWMSHVTYVWGMSHMNESFHMWIGHITYESDMLRMDAHEWVEATSSKPRSTLWMSRVKYPVVMSDMKESIHTWMSNVKAHTTEIPYLAWR